MAELTRPYTAKEWNIGDIITADKLNDIENIIASIDSEIIDARNYNSSSTGSIGSRIDELVQVSRDLKNAIGYVTGVIENALINSSGVIESTLVWDTYIYKVSPLSTIRKISTDPLTTQIEYAFYTSKPVLGSVSFNNKRVYADLNSMENIDVPEGCNWIAVRDTKVHNPAIEFVNLSELSTALVYKRNPTKQSADDYLDTGIYFVPSTVENLPSDNDYILQVIKSMNNSFQFATSISGNNRGAYFTRRYANNSWNAWHSNGNTKPPVMLSIVDDDGHLDYKTYLLPFAKSLNAPIASAVTTLRMGNDTVVGRYMTLEEIKECMLEGAEILNHSYSHSQNNEDVKKIKVQTGQYVGATTFNDENGNSVQLERYTTYHDTVSDKYYYYDNAILNEIVPYPADYDKTIAVYTDVTGYYDANGTPIYTDVNDYFADKLGKYYNIASNVLASIGCKTGDIVVYNNSTGFDALSVNAAKQSMRYGVAGGNRTLNVFGKINKMAIQRCGLDYDLNAHYNVQAMKDMIDNAVSNQGWLIWTLHTTSDDWRGVNGGIGREAVLERLKQGIEYARSKGVKIVTMAQGAEAYIEGKY